MFFSFSKFKKRMGNANSLAEIVLADDIKAVLLRERKRSERSHRPILFVTLDISRLKNCLLSNNKLAKLFSQALLASIREIDYKGWYERNKVIGIIFSEINKEGADAICSKISRNLLEKIGRENTALISCEAITFPTDSTPKKIDLSKYLYINKSAGNSENFGPPKGNSMDSRLKNVDLSKHLYINQRAAKGSIFQSLIGKRALDISCGLACILLFSPLFIIIPILIKLTSKGPVFFRQERIGRGGKIFQCFKFRSMVDKNDPLIHRQYVRSLIKKGEKDEGTIKKLTCDPRITLIGRFLRKLSLDELPQFFNVIKGDMSLVGPRPAIPYELEDYEIWHKRRLYEVKPGLTGIWQVKGRSKTTFNDMVRMDIEYMDSWSLLKDLHLIFLTPFAMLSTNGAH